MSVRVDYRCATCGGVAEHAVASPPPPERPCVACGSPAKRLFAPIGLRRSAHPAGPGAPAEPPGSRGARSPSDAMCLRAPAVPGICHMQAGETLEWVRHILKAERDIVIASDPLEVAAVEVENIRWPYVFYQSGLAVNVMYALDDPNKRAVGFKLCEGIEVPAELDAFKFARQKSKLAGTIRGSYFVIKGEY